VLFPGTLLAVLGVAMFSLCLHEYSTTQGESTRASRPDKHLANTTSGVDHESVGAAPCGAEGQQGEQAPTSRSVFLNVLAISCLQPALLAIDHGHFQYNGLGVGLTVRSLCVACAQDVQAILTAARMIIEDVTSSHHTKQRSRRSQCRLGSR
jgi:ALG6, ALG8 glycosyltransferase family